MDEVLQKLPVETYLDIGLVLVDSLVFRRVERKSELALI